MKQLLILGIVFVLSLYLVSAATDTQQVEDTFKLNERIDYSKACFNNGSYCSSAAVCNYTIYLPNRTILIDNQIASNQGSSHNVSFFTQSLGVHQVDMVCCDGADCGSETIFFETTGSGLNNSAWFFVIILLISFGIIIFGFAISDAPMTILGSLGLYFVGIYVLFNGLGTIQDSITTWSTGIIILGVAFYISTKSTFELIGD